MSTKTRVFRPLGLTIAILTGIIAFSAYPLLKAYFAWRLNNCTTVDGFTCGSTTFPFDALTQGIAGLGILVFITAIFAWRGKPPEIRFVFQGSVLLTAVMLVLESIIRIQGDKPTIWEGGIDSTVQLFESVLKGQIPILILVALYIIWYCNRAPARAFYRQEAMKTLREIMEENKE